MVPASGINFDAAIARAAADGIAKDCAHNPAAPVTAGVEISYFFFGFASL
jgi:hypothetical protein